MFEVLGGLLGTVVCLVLTEGAANRLGRLGAAEVARALDTRGALGTEGPSDGAPVSLLEVLGAPLGAPVGPPLSEGPADMLGVVDMLGVEETLGALDAEGLSEGAPVVGSKVLRALLGTLIGLSLTEGDANLLGAVNLLVAEDTLGALNCK